MMVLVPSSGTLFSELAHFWTPNKVRNGHKDPLTVYFILFGSGVPYSLLVDFLYEVTGPYTIFSQN